MIDTRGRMKLLRAMWQNSLKEGGPPFYVTNTLGGDTSVEDFAFETMLAIHAKRQKKAPEARRRPELFGV